MKFHVLIYDGFVSFEVMLATYLLKTKGDMVTVGLSTDPVTSYEGFKMLPSVSISELSADDIQLLLIPGGDIQEIQSNTALNTLINRLDQRKAYIATICSASQLLNMERLSAEQKRQLTNSAGVTIEGNLIIAKANKYVDFAIELGKIMNIYRDKDDLEETIQYFKFFKES